MCMYVRLFASNLNCGFRLERKLLCSVSLIVPIRILIHLISGPILRYNISMCQAQTLYSPARLRRSSTSRYQESPWARPSGCRPAARSVVALSSPASPAPAPATPSATARTPALAPDTPCPASPSILSLASSLAFPFPLHFVNVPLDASYTY